MTPTPTQAAEARRAEIAERCNAATEGPWEPVYAEDRQHMGWVRGSGPLDRTVCLVGASDEDEEAANIDFIAHAREDIPWLLSEIDRLEAALAAREDVFEECAKVADAMARKEPETPSMFARGMQNGAGLVADKIRALAARPTPADNQSKEK